MSTIHLYNTLTRKKELFTPLRDDSVHIYVCGITAYDLCHIGHARSAVVFDVLIRHLRNRGYNVRFIRNFTDIDDKIIARAQREGRDWREVGTTYMQTFHEDMDALGVLRADLEPKATEYIAQIISMCERLCSQGRAYATEAGNVYFRVRDYAPYGRLSRRSLDELQAGASARVSLETDKEDALDFALWKAAKPGEPFWESPFGQGRPGWHIECSAMTEPWLPLDIHGGGQDLIFPHHENEMAQSEACLHKELAHFWIHNGFVQINAEKMSKSLGNFKTIRDILESYLPETLRFFLLGKHYRSPIDFTFEAMEEAERSEKRLYLALRDAKVALQRASWKKGPLPEELLGQWRELEEKFNNAMDDDLNTAQAIGEIFAQVHLVNRILEDKTLRAKEGTKALLNDFLARAAVWHKCLGILGMEPETFLLQLRNCKVARLHLDMERVTNLLSARKQARSQKDFASSDALRDELAALGVLVQDTQDGQKWDLA